MTTIDRNELIAEELIREHIRKRISEKIKFQLQQERKLASVVRSLLEAEAGTEEPSTYTGINVLANLLEKVIPIIEDHYKMLTTSEEQRESFRNHIIHAVKNSLKPIEVSTSAEKSNSKGDPKRNSGVEESLVYDVNPRKLLEDLKIDLDPQTDGEEQSSVDNEFIDISEPDEDSDFVQIQDQNETGRNFAATTYKQVEKQIVDAYDMLADEEDQKLFYDYLLTNLMLYFDKFEDELQNELPSVTTPEYEEEKNGSEDEEEI